MSAKVWEVAGALRKSISTVENDLKNLGVKIKSYAEVISDNKIIQLAEAYNRRKSILLLISNDYIHELAQTWSEEEVWEMMPELEKAEGYLSEYESERIVVIMQYIKKMKEEVICSELTYKKPKAFHGIQLIGVDEKAIMRVDENIQMLLIPKSKEKLHDCFIKLKNNSLIRMKINIKECMILLWEDGNYYYEPAVFTRVNDLFYLDLEKYLEEKRVTLKGNGRQQWNSRGIWKMSAYVQPGRKGYAVQDVVLWKKNYKEEKYANCRILLNKKHQEASNEQLKNYFWSTDKKAETIQGNEVIRKQINEYLK